MSSNPHGVVPGRRSPEPVAGVRELDHQPAAYQAAGELLKALSSPTRIAIVTVLTAGPRCVHELVDALGAAQPLVSQHLRVLRAAGVVSAQRRGREVCYHLADHHVGHIVADAVAHAVE